MKRQLEVGNSRVSKVEVAANRYGNVEHHYLLLRTDLEGGGWAEPVFRKGKLIGLTAAQESLSARVLPAEIITAYLDRVAAPGGYRSFPFLEVVWQNNQVNGYGAEASNQVPSDRVIFGNWADALFADWDGMDVVVDPYSLKKKGQVEITIQLMTDFAVRHAESFCASTDSGAQ